MKINPKETLGVGILSIVVIFVILALTVLASLGVISSSADYNLSKKNGEAIKAYYEAEKVAEEILGHIYESSVLKEDYTIPVEHIVDEQDDKTYISYQVPIGETQLLKVGMTVPNRPEKGEKPYQILEWRVINNTEWEYGESPFEDGIMIDNEKGFGE